MIFKHELSKICKAPVIIALLIFFIILNAILMMSNTYFKEEFAVLTELVDTYGHEIDQEMLETLGDDYEEGVAWLNENVPLNNKTYDHPSEMLSDRSLSFQEWTEPQVLKLQDLAVVEHYYRTSHDIDNIYEDIRVQDQAEKMILQYGIEGKAAETVRQQYEKLGNRLEEIVDNQEHRHLFFSGILYEMHSHLFKEVGGALIFELMVLVVLITTFVMNYEFEQRTHLLTYTSKTGRSLVWHKIIAAVTANLLVMAILIGATLTSYFLMYDYSGLWNIPISSYFNAESSFPYISWWDVSFGQYLSLFVVCLVSIQLLFMLFSIVLSILIKNSYIVFFIFAIITGMGVWLPSIIPLDQNLLFVAHFTPFTLILNPHIWFMGNGAFTIFPYYEGLTVMTWLIITSSFMSICIYVFKRQSLQ